MDTAAFAGVVEQARQVRDGDVSSRELTELALGRIAEHDPELNAFKAVWPDTALDAADAADAARATGDDRPLLGVPIAIKDDMDVAGDVTGFGTIGQRTPAGADAPFVALLREAGAVLIGKTHVPELMTMPFTETTWNGVTRNPWDLDRTPGGSSGGSGAAVAAGLVAAGTASDGAGSIRIPAVSCGLVGLKATAGRVPTPPSWNGLSTYGFVTRRAEDAILLQGLVDRELGEVGEPGRLRVAMATNVPVGARGRPDADVLGGLASLADALRALGHEVTEARLDYGTAGTRVMARYLRAIHDSAAEVEAPDRLGARTRGMARLGGLVPRAVLQKAIAAAEADRARIGRVYEHADVVLAPVLNTLPLRIGRLEGLGALRTVDALNAYASIGATFNHTGQPAVAVPAPATAAGFPLGGQLIGPLGSDALLLGLARQLEREVGWDRRVPPGFEG